MLASSMLSKRRTISTSIAASSIRTALGAGRLMVSCLPECIKCLADRPHRGYRFWIITMHTERVARQLEQRAVCCRQGFAPRQADGLGHDGCLVMMDSTWQPPGDEMPLAVISPVGKGFEPDRHVHFSCQLPAWLRI